VPATSISSPAPFQTTFLPFFSPPCPDLWVFPSLCAPCTC